MARAYRIEAQFLYISVSIKKKEKRPPKKVMIKVIPG